MPVVAPVNGAYLLRIVAMVVAHSPRLYRRVQLPYVPSTAQPTLLLPMIADGTTASV